MNSVQFGQTIRQARKLAGLTQAEVASLCSVSVPFLSHLESGKPTVQLNKALYVASQLGIVFATQIPRSAKSGTR